jgi:CxxC-x17-CxxC domain-containing protein
MDEEVQDAVMGNMGTMITFRVGAGDAELFEKEFEPEFTVNDLVNLGFAHIYLKLMIDGFASRPFSATTLPPVSFPKGDNVQSIIQSSRDKYAVPRGTVEAQITEWYKPVGPEKKEESRGDSHARVSRSLPHAGSPQGDKPASYPASCVVCGKRIYVPFEPDGKKPLYCKEHMPAPGDSGQSRRVLPTSLNDGQIVPKSFGERDANQPIRTISLKDLNTKKGKSGESDELKKLLEEIKSGQSKKEPAPKEQIKEVEMAPTPEAKTEETHTAKKGKLKPGQKIKFE